MQELTSALRPGRVVSARGTTWTVAGVEQAEGCAAVDLIGVDAEDSGLRRTLLVPYDSICPVADPDRPRPLGPGPAFVAVSLLAAGALPWPAPAAVIPASIDLLPHQLSAWLAFRTGASRRVLVADAVGTGKTIQAGIAIAEVTRLEQHARVLVLVPAGLKTQWLTELGGRFRLDVDAIDGTVPVNERWAEEVDNPWGRAGVFLASFDYVKRPEVIAGLHGLRWHLVVVDEAHHATRSTDRGAAIDMLCRRATNVMLLTATPHDGDEARYRALCQLGSLEDDRALVLRRAPRHPACGGRLRLHGLSVRPSPEELHARAILTRYLGAIESAGARGGQDGRGAGTLLASVFEKRVSSSPAALERTARRRLALLSDGQGARQTLLPFEGEPDEDGDGNDAAHLGRAGPLAWPHERAWLGALAEAAARARRGCTKLAALRKLLRRIREPVIVFTEYRDTLAWLASELHRFGPAGCLHGLQLPSEREAQLGAFLRGRVRWLLATDVAAEGLNLQARCRAVVEFDVPWTAVRSEQRVGRVDRIGQQSRVHAWTLTTEAGPDARLVAARADRRDRAGRALAAHAAPQDVPGSVERRCAEALASARRLSSRVPEHVQPRLLASLMGASPRVAFASDRRLLRLGLPPGTALLLAQALVTDGRGARLESFPVPVIVRLGPARSLAGVIGQAVAPAMALARGRADARGSELMLQVASATESTASWRAAVERDVVRSVSASARQPGLFSVDAGTNTHPLGPGREATLPVTSLDACVRFALIVLPRRFRGVRSRP